MTLFRLYLMKLLPRRIISNSRVAFSIFRQLSSKNKSNVEDEEDRPIIYSTSYANKWKAASSRSGTESDRLWYEPYVVLASVVVFMVYFCILREENDVDIELGRSLYSRIQGLEELQLRQSLKYNLEHGLPTEDIKEKLREIESRKAND